LNISKKNKLAYRIITGQKNVEKIHDILIKQNIIDIDYDDNQILYYLGHYNFIIKNYDEAIRLYEMALKKGNEFTINIIGDMYEHKLCSDNDFNIFIKLCESQIEKGNQFAMHYFGFIHQCGEVVDKDIDKAIKLHKMAIEKGNEFAMNSLADIYICEKGFSANSIESIKLYKMSIKKGFANAMNNLAFVYENGKGVNKNLNKAAKYYAMYCKNTNETLSEYIDLKEDSIVWKHYLHEYWPNKEFISKQIIILLLISKNRSTNNKLKWMVKGITEIIIGFLATFEKI